MIPEEFRFTCDDGLCHADYALAYHGCGQIIRHNDIKAHSRLDQLAPQYGIWQDRSDHHRHCSDW